jgi:alpha-L-fucosidase 2
MKTVFAFGMLLSLALICPARAGETIAWYQQPAKAWHEALPVGNGGIGTMVFGGVEKELLQLNEQTVWSGSRSDYDRVGAYKHLPEIRRLLFAGKQADAEALVKRGEVARPLILQRFTVYGEQ